MKTSEPHTIFCGQCGKPNRSDSKYCFACGQSISSFPGAPSQNIPPTDNKVALKSVLQRKWIFLALGLLLVAGILIILVQNLLPGATSNSIVGKWSYTATQNGYDAFQEDIEFYSDGTCFVPSPLLITKTLQYSFPTSGKIRFAAGNFSMIYDYRLDRNNLRISFEDGGTNDYVRTSANSTGANNAISRYPVINTNNVNRLKPLMGYVPGFLGLGKRELGIDTFYNVNTWSPDSKLLYIGNGVVDVTSDDLILKDVYAGANIITPDGKKFVSGNNGVVVRDEKRQTLATFPGELKQISPDSTFVVVFDKNENSYGIWDLISYQQKAKISIEAGYFYNLLNISKNGRLIAFDKFKLYDTDRFIEFWDTKTWKMVKQVSYKSVINGWPECQTFGIGGIFVAQFSHDEKKLAVMVASVCQKDGQIIVIDVSTGSFLQIFPAQSAGGLKSSLGNILEFTADDSMLFVYIEKKESPYLYDWKNKKTTYTFPKSPCGWSRIPFSPDGRFFMNGCQLLAVQ